jgi:hypothetical protein
VHYPKRRCRVALVKRVDAGARTISFFGKKWIKNYFKNLNLLNRSLTYYVMDMPVLVVGAGPGLEVLLPKIRLIQKNIFLFFRNIWTSNNSF